MGKLISIVLSVMVVLGLMLVPVAPVTNVALAQPNVIGLNVTPADTGPLGIGDSGTVVLWIVNPTAEAYSSVGIRMTYDPTVIDVTLVTPNPAFTFPLKNSAAGGLLKSDNAYLSAITTTTWACQVDFDAIGAGVNSPLTFIPVDPLDPLGITAVMEGANDKVDWSMVVNGTVTVLSGAGARCCADMSPSGGGTVEIDGVVQACKQVAGPDYVFDVEAFPNAGYELDSPIWTGAVTNPDANPTTVSVTGGATVNVTANFQLLPAEACANVSTVDFGVLFVGDGNPSTEVVLVTNCGGAPLNWNSAIDSDPGNPDGGGVVASRSPTFGALAMGASEPVDVDVNIVGLTDIGLYKAYLTLTPGTANVTVQFTLLPPGAPVREIVQDVCYAGDTVDVFVNWSASADDFNAVGLTDSAAVTGAAVDNWPVAVAACSPAATESKINGGANEQIEYAWTMTNYTSGTNFVAAYQIMVPGGAIPGVYDLTLDNVNVAWLEYYISENPARAAVTGEYQITVIAGRPLNVTVYEVVYNLWGTDLLMPGATVDLRYTINGTLAQTATADAFGVAAFGLVLAGDYYLEASMAGFTTETGASVVVTGLEAFLPDEEFIGNTGLEPTTCTMSYALRAVNCWLYAPVATPAAALNAGHAVSVVNVWLATP